MKRISFISSLVNGVGTENRPTKNQGWANLRLTLFSLEFWIGLPFAIDCIIKRPFNELKKL